MVTRNSNAGANRPTGESIVNLHLSLTPWVVGPLLAAATYLACHWWYGRRIAEMLQRLEKIDRARQSADELAQQARRQIEQLQKDLAAQYRARTEALSAKKRAENASEDRRELERVLLIGDEDHGAKASARPHGFADTQPMA